MTRLRQDPAFDALVPPAATLRLLGDGYSWAEGPTWDACRQTLVFSDVVQNRIIGWTADAGPRDLLRPSHHQNGHCTDAAGRLIACSHGQRALLRREDDDRWAVLADRFEGARLNSPNDVALHPDGSLWFTDPTYGLEKPTEGYGGDKEIAGQFVFRLAPDGSLTAPIRDLDQPNGICFVSHDRLLVSDTGADPATHAFIIAADGTVRHDGVFVRVSPGLTDGLRAGASGHLWLSAGDGVHVLTPDGRELGRIRTPKTAANLCFGGASGTTLFITATDALWAIETNESAADIGLPTGA